MRNCPVCEYPERDPMFSMSYRIPDGWTLPSQIDWYTCGKCGMLYGDGEFDQSMLDTYYRERYGYGLNSEENVARLKADAMWIVENFTTTARIIDFGGAGDDGRSVLVDELQRMGFADAICVNAGEILPKTNVIYASHVLEHVYDLVQVMRLFSLQLVKDGLLIIDGPDATGILQRWNMPILDFNTKHINHFTLRDYLNLAHRYGFELVHLKQYEMGFAPCYQLHFKRLDVAYQSAWHVMSNADKRVKQLRAIREPVNVWGLGDITWHLLSWVEDLRVLDYIDNDPAFRGQTYRGKPVQEKPTNDAPILIMAQGQRQRLIENIRKAGITNDIIEI